MLKLCYVCVRYKIHLWIKLLILLFEEVNFSFVRERPPIMLADAVLFLEGGQFTLCVMLNWSRQSFSGIDMPLIVRLFDILLSESWRLISR